MMIEIPLQTAIIQLLKSNAKIGEWFNVCDNKYLMDVPMMLVGKLMKQVSINLDEIASLIEDPTNYHQPKIYEYTKNEMNPQSGYSAEQMKDYAVKFYNAYKNHRSNVMFIFPPLPPSPDLQSKYDRLKEAYIEVAGKYAYGVRIFEDSRIKFINELKQKAGI